MEVTVRSSRNLLTSWRAKLSKNFAQARVLAMKVMLMRRNSPLATFFEIFVPLALFLQLRLVFQPLVLHLRELDQRNGETILGSIPEGVKCRYAPRSAFLDDLMGKASTLLKITVSPAKDEGELMTTYNATARTLLAIFSGNGASSAKPEILEYKIRSSDIGDVDAFADPQSSENGAISDPYMESGFIALQMAIEHSFVQMWSSRNSMLGNNVTVGRFPLHMAIGFLATPSFVKPNVSLIYWMTFVSLLVTPIVTLEKIIHDKMTGFRDMMRLMNVSVINLYFSWICFALVAALPVTVVGTFLLKAIYINSRPATIAIFILLYTLTSVCFMLMIAMFFQHTMRAILAGIMSWIFLAYFTIDVNRSLMNLDSSTRYLSLMLPHSGLYYGLVTFTSASGMDESGRKLADVNGSTLSVEDEAVTDDENFDYLDIYEVIHQKDKISIDVIFFTWLLHVVFWSLLALYFVNVNPGRFGSAKGWYYPCKNFFTSPVDVSFTTKGSTNWSAVERGSKYAKPSVRLRNVTKDFGSMRTRTTAIDDVSIDFYRDEFNIMLGHNGAGKSTLLKVMIGIHKPTSGDVYMEGRDFNIKRKKVNLVSYCPQENVLVKYLTVLQHIWLFGVLKGLSYKAAREEALRLVHDLDLTTKMDLKPDRLPFSVKRQVCLAMALIGDSTFLILDEPTFGIDFEHKKRTWNLISDTKSDRTLIVATNSMEVADTLADRIYIIANGKIECSGSKMYLSKRYGIGYVMTVIMREGCNVRELHLAIQKNSPGLVNLRGTMGLIARFDLPRGTRFDNLLQHLDQNKAELKIDSVKLSSASIQGHFLQIGLASYFKDRNVFYPRTKYEKIVQKRRRDLLRAGNTWKKKTGNGLRRQQLCVLFRKKFLHILSAWKLYLFAIISSTMTVVLVMLMARLGSFAIFHSVNRELNVTEYTDKHFYILYHAIDNEESKNFLTTLSSTGQSYDKRINFHISDRFTAYDLIQHPNMSSIEFKDRYFMSVDILKSGSLNVMYSSTAVHSGPIAVNLLHNAILRHLSGSEKVAIKLNSHPIADPSDWRHHIVRPRNIRYWENVAIAMGLFLVLPAIDMVTKELKTGSKELQLNVAGVVSFAYWMTIFLVDISIYVICLLIVFLICYIVYFKNVIIGSLQSLLLFCIFVLYGAATFPIMYLVHLTTRRTGLVYFIIILSNVVIILMINGAVMLPLISRYVPKIGHLVVEVILHVFPPYILACTVSNYLIISLFNQQCAEGKNCDTDSAWNDACCYETCGSNPCFKPLNISDTRQSGIKYHHSVLSDIYLMILEPFVLFVLLEIFESRRLRKWLGMFSRIVKKRRVEEGIIDCEMERRLTDVSLETRLVEEAMLEFKRKRQLPHDVVLVAEGLSKSYGKKKAVRGVNFSIHRNECFGLLGTNGCGKTTIFKLLTGGTRASEGTAVAQGFDLKKDSKSFVSMLGYCPQHGGLNEFMTGRENLEMFAGLRGIPAKKIAEEVDRWLDIFDLLDFESLKLENCPWGVQRKICVLQSLIGDLPIILLDDPFSGVDPIARHAFVDTLHQVREMGRSLVIATHDMTEVEALCSRVGILDEGKFVTFGSCEQLKQKYRGRNFKLNVRLRPEIDLKTLQEVKSTIEEMFPGIRFKKQHLSILKYEFDGDISYIQIFEMLEKLKAKHSPVTDFSVNQPTLNEVLLMLTKRSNEKNLISKPCSAGTNHLNDTEDHAL